MAKSERFFARRSNSTFSTIGDLILINSHAVAGRLSLSDVTISEIILVSKTFLKDILILKMGVIMNLSVITKSLQFFRKRVPQKLISISFGHTNIIRQRQC